MSWASRRDRRQPKEMQMPRMMKFPVITIVILKAILTSLEDIDKQLKDALDAANDAAGLKKKLQWANHIPQLAMAVCNMLNLDPQRFTWFQFSADDVKNLNEATELLREIKAFFDRLSTTVGEILALYRDQLFTLTTQCASDVQKVI